MGAGKADASKDGAGLLGQHSQATGHRGEVSHTQRHFNSTNGGGRESNHVSDTGTGTVRQSDGEHATQQNADVKSFINKDRQVVLNLMPLGGR